MSTIIHIDDHTADRFTWFMMYNLGYREPRFGVPAHAIQFFYFKSVYRITLYRRCDPWYDWVTGYVWYNVVPIGRMDVKWWW